MNKGETQIIKYKYISVNIKFYDNHFSFPHF